MKITENRREVQSPPLVSITVELTAEEVGYIQTRAFVENTGRGREATISGSSTAADLIREIQRVKL